MIGEVLITPYANCSKIVKNLTLLRVRMAIYLVCIWSAFNLHLREGRNWSGF